MTRGKRIALEILGPPALGAGLWGGCMLVVAASQIGPAWPTWHDLAHAAGFFLLVLLMAYVFAGIPALLYTAVMEASFARGLRPGGAGAVMLSTLLGTMSGLGIVGVISGFASPSEAVLFFSGTGLLVGLAIGLIVRRGMPRGVPGI